MDLGAVEISIERKRGLSRSLAHMQPASNESRNAHPFGPRALDKRRFEAAHVDGHEVVVKVAHGQAKVRSEDFLNRRQAAYPALPYVFNIVDKPSHAFTSFRQNW